MKKRIQSMQVTHAHHGTYRKVNLVESNASESSESVEERGASAGMATANDTEGAEIAQHENESGGNRLQWI